MKLGYTAQEEQTQRVEDLLLYRGTNNRPRKAHLIFKNQETTLCNRVEADRTKTGKINGNKAYTFKGLDRVLGKLCKNCKEIYKKEVK